MVTFEVTSAWYPRPGAKCSVDKMRCALPSGVSYVCRQGFHGTGSHGNSQGIPLIKVTCESHTNMTFKFFIVKLVSVTTCRR